MVARNMLRRQLLQLSKCPFTRCVVNFSQSPVNVSSEIDKKFKLTSRYAGSEKSVWVEYFDIILKHKPLNLGHGLPDYSPPKYITDTLAEVASSDDCPVHQYTRGFGHPRLVNILAKLYSQLIGRQIDPQTEILTTMGAYEAVFSSIVGHTDVGDEVIIIEPYFDCYDSVVKCAGGVPRYIPLKPKTRGDGVITSADWVLDKKELEGLFNSKTKIIILNTPHNPLGKVFNQEELELIADLCKKWNVLCISDEVYEWFVYKPNNHIRIATLPGMWERTISIGSAGKTFSVTGWKVGWAYGPANLLVNLQMVHQNCVYTGNTPAQEAIAINFERELAKLGQKQCYFESISEKLVIKRDYMAKLLSHVGMKPTIPEGGYFMVADWSPLESRVDLNSEKDKYKDYRFTKWMVKNVGLLGIPLSPFYSEPNKPLSEDLVRYNFFKKDETLEKAEEILTKWKNEK